MKILHRRTSKGEDALIKLYEKKALNSELDSLSCYADVRALGHAD